MEPFLKPGEQIDDLQRGGLHIIQSKEGFRFGMDAVLLCDFTQVRPGDRVADMGTGTGIIPLLLSQNQNRCTIAAFEIQPEMGEMARRSVEMNGLNHRIEIHVTDMRNAKDILGYETVNAVTCNPPYFKQGAALPSQKESMLVSKHERDISLQEIVNACSAILKNQGRLTMVFPASRMLELFDALRTRRLEPKRLRMVHTKVERAPYLVLVEAVKNARPGLLLLPPLIVYDHEGKVTSEINRIYHR